MLELTNVLAGPTVGKLWSDMGADVIKLEPPRGDISRPGMNIGFAYLNSNKRSISVDAKTPGGRRSPRGWPRRPTFSWRTCGRGPPREWVSERRR